MMPCAGGCEGGLWKPRGRTLSAQICKLAAFAMLAALPVVSAAARPPPSLTETQPVPGCYLRLDWGISSGTKLPSAAPLETPMGPVPECPGAEEATAGFAWSFEIHKFITPSEGYFVMGTMGRSYAGSSIETRRPTPAEACRLVGAGPPVSVTEGGDLVVCGKVSLEK